MFAEIIINSNAKALNKVFDYIIPKELENDIRIGSRVFVPFGKGNGKVEDGFVINIKEKSEFANKEILRIDKADSVTIDRIELSKLMAYKYFCNISDCIKLMIPPGTGNKDASKRMKSKKGNFIYLKISPDNLENVINNLKNQNHIRVLNILKQNDGLYISDLENIADVSRAILKTMEKNELIEIREEDIDRDPLGYKKIKKDIPKELNVEQKNCYDIISNDIDNNVNNNYLLFGITGSGKTEVYMQLISRAISQNKNAIMLVPEISLTPQMTNRFLARFGNNIAVLHSRLSPGERFDEWKKIKEGLAKIVIGARSALFAPLENIGIIIIDEEHDASYKSEMPPRYDVRDIAKYMAKQGNFPLVLGSATPDVCDYHKAENQDFTLLTLSKRANSNAILPQSKIVDMRLELSNGNYSMISLELQKELQENLNRKEQSILFLNRRGYSTFVMCRDCGYVAKCKNCNISLTYHKYENILKCHYCGMEMPVIKECPNCKSNKVKYFGSGTQKLEDEIAKLYPEATMIRMDIDTVSKKNSHEEILSRFIDEKIDILIGTQMVAKGHDFGNVTLVGILSADSILNFGDYRAVEKTYQTIVQVSGRAGRANKPGRVVIQTYNPDHYAITMAQEQDYKLFYNSEIQLRKMLKYPPFCDIILIRFQGKNLNEIKRISTLIYKILNEIFKNTHDEIFKPVPSPIDKIQGKYRWRIIIKGKVNKNIIEAINYSLSKVKNQGDTTISIDINPNSMM